MQHCIIFELIILRTIISRRLHCNRVLRDLEDSTPETSYSMVITDFYTTGHYGPFPYTKCYFGKTKYYAALRTYFL